MRDHKRERNQSERRTEVGEARHSGAQDHRPGAAARNQPARLVHIQDCLPGGSVSQRPVQIIRPASGKVDQVGLADLRRKGGILSMIAIPDR